MGIGFVAITVRYVDTREFPIGAWGRRSTGHTGPRTRTIHMCMCVQDSWSLDEVCVQRLSSGLVRGRPKWRVIRFTRPSILPGAEGASLVAVVEQMKRVLRYRRTVGGASSTPSAILGHPGRVPVTESIHQVRKSLRSENLIIQHLNGGRWHAINAFFVHSMMIDKL